MHNNTVYYHLKLACQLPQTEIGSWNQCNVQICPGLYIHSHTLADILDIGDSLCPQSMFIPLNLWLSFSIRNIKITIVSTKKIVYWEMNMCSKKLTSCSLNFVTRLLVGFRNCNWNAPTVWDYWKRSNDQE